jgi:serine/threonine protein kinase
MALTLEQFREQLITSGIMSGESIESALHEANSVPADGEQLARLLVRLKKLTPYQAQQIYSGKGKSLIFGNYLVLEKLGQGGMGIVLKARHRRMRRDVAIKVLPAAMVKDEAAIARFQREVVAAAQLMHTNIVAAHDADEINGQHVLIMEFVEGRDLSSIVRKDGPLKIEEAIDCVLQAARGLEFAHKRGVIHRDIKPANLLLDHTGTVKVLDMGLARFSEDAGDVGTQAELTGTGTIMGTVDYMSPEQALSTKSADARCDIYSLGVTLYYLITGQPPYSGETLTARLLAHQTAPIPSLSGLVPAVSRNLQAVFEKMVAKRPEDRYSSMTDVITDLLACQSDQPDASLLPRAADSAAGSGSGIFGFLKTLDGGNARPASSTRLAGAPDRKTGPLPNEATLINGTNSGTMPVPARVGGTFRLSGKLPLRDWRVLFGGGICIAAMLAAMVAFSGRSRENIAAVADGIPPVLQPAISTLATSVPTGINDRGSANAAGIPGTVEPSNPSPVAGASSTTSQTTAQAIDLLEKIKKNEKGVVVVGLGRDKGAYPILFPVAEIPTAYRLELELDREPGSLRSEVNLAVDGHVVCFVFSPSPTSESAKSGFKNGLDRLDGRKVTDPDNPTSSEGHILIEGQPNRVVCEVSPGRIWIAVNEKTVVDWKGDSSRLSPHDNLANLLKKTRFRLGLAQWSGRLFCSKALLIPLDERPQPELVTAPEPPPAGAVLKTVDLLPLVDLNRDAGLGKWKQVSDGISCENPAGANVLQLPYEPSEEYDFEIEFTPTGGAMNVNQYLAANDRMFTWKLNSHGVNPPLYGFELLDGKLAKDNREAATQISEPIRDGQRFRSTVEVRRGSLRALLNGRQLVYWKGDFNRLGMEPSTPMPHPGRLGIGSWRRSVTFHSARVREISGSGRLLNTAEPPPSSSQGVSRRWPFDPPDGRDYEWSQPVNLGSAINSPSREALAGISGDERTLYLERPGGPLLISKRKSLDEPFPEPEPIGPQMTMSDSCVSANGLCVVMVKSAKGLPDEIWVSSRSDLSSPFPKLEPASALVNREGARHPMLASDGLSLFVTSSRSGGTHGDVWMFTRAALDQPFSTEQRLSEPVNSADWEMPCFLTGDLRLLIVARQYRSQTESLREFIPFYRAQADSPFDPGLPMMLPLGELADSPRNNGFKLSGDGRSLYFVSPLSGGLGDNDIWVSRRIPQ